MASPALFVLEKLLNLVTPFLETVATISENVSSIVGGLVELASLDMAKVFTDLTNGLGTIGDVVMGGDKGMEITHTLENLALITAGVSAKTNNNNIGSIAKAIKGIQPAFNVQISLDSSETKDLWERGVFEKITKPK